MGSSRLEPPAHLTGQVLPTGISRGPGPPDLPSPLTPGSSCHRPKGSGSVCLGVQPPQPPSRCARGRPAQNLLSSVFLATLSCSTLGGSRSIPAAVLWTFTLPLIRLSALHPTWGQQGQSPWPGWSLCPPLLLGIPATAARGNLAHQSPAPGTYTRECMAHLAPVKAVGLLE